MLLSFPPHIHFVGQFLSRLDFVVQSPNIHTKCLIQPYWFWKAQNCVLMQKKCSARLVRFLHFLFWLKTCFVRPQLAYKETSILLLHHTIFSHFWKNVVSKDCSILSKIVQKPYFYVKKVFRPLGQILTFFVLTKTVFFTASTSLQRKLNFLASSHNFLTFLIFRDNIFSKIWENRVMKQENWAFLASWLKP